MRLSSSRSQRAGGRGNELLAYAKEYLNERQVNATFLHETGSVRKAIVRTARQYQCDLIIMGGYGRDPLLELFFGSTTNHILRTKKISDSHLSLIPGVEKCYILMRCEGKA